MRTVFRPRPAYPQLRKMRVQLFPASAPSGFKAYWVRVKSYIIGGGVS